jgi:uncharacterized protein
MLKEKLINQIKFNIGTITPIIEPVTACNLNCSYCFIGNKKKEKMSDATLEKIISSVIEYNGIEKVTKFIWHGGEPLIAGLSFFKKAVEIQNIYRLKGYRILNAIQTNLTLLNDKFIDFFLENEFGVGTSLDGNKYLHDKNRNNSFDRVYNNLMIAKQRGLHVGVICILSKETIKYIDEIYYFFRNNNFDFTLSPVIPNKRYMENILTPEEYYNALKRLFELWYYDSECRIRVNPCGSIIQSILLKGINLSCIHSENCLNHFMTFLPNGDVYPCNRFTDYSDFYIGNICSDTFSNILNSERRKKLTNRVANNIPECTNCEYKAYCKGGCMNHAYEFYGAVNKPDYYCKSFFRIFKDINQSINNSIQKSKINNFNYGTIKGV